ncbi:hypothetical protein AAFF_G00381850 [Aldrovandia affinis]|uniref:Myozenin-3 n=1 Tax=Aldrovandia affinis TaxID=143900 RepID=A0AAD7T981_9TELE|nr:hypothetical protein AAFF_G00381850 [Aldrovandia affinis]
MIQVTYRDLEKPRQQQSLDLSLEDLGDHLDLGRKISVPQDVMLEELQLQNNKGSRMFHQRLRRVDRFVLENAADSPHTAGQSDQLGEGQIQAQGSEEGKHDLLSTLKTTIAKKGSPDVLAPGYSGPLEAVPHERFNITVIPKAYSCPWPRELSDSDTIRPSVSARLPQLPQKLTPADYRCFNRAPMPFGGTAGSPRILPLPGFELLEAYTEPHLTWERVCRRPNFNRAPQGWKSGQTPEPATL